MNATFSDLYKEFLVYVDKEDEEGARNFLLDNLQKFPQKIQDKLTFAFFEEAMRAEGGGVRSIAEMQKRGLNAIDKINKTQKVLKDKIKVEDLRAKLSQ
ncbi:MAG: hypothetical protein WAV15_02430 [Minisyncoccia bacterium]